MRTSHSFVFLVALGLAFLASCGPDSGPPERSTALEEISLRLPIPVVDTAFSPYYLAQDLGIFEKHGLSVEIEPGSPELNPVRMVDSGADEFGVLGGPELLMSGRAAGAQIQGIALVHRDANFSVIVAEAESGIETVEDLQGKKIGFFIGHISTDVIRALLRQEGIEHKEVDVGFNYGPLLSGKIDAEWAFRTTAGITLPQQGVKLNVIQPADYGIVTQGHLLVTHDRLIEERPELVQAFVDAVLEAIEYELEKPQAAIHAAVERDSGLSPEVGRQQVAIYHETIRRNSPLGWIPPEAMENDAARQKSLGVLRETFSVSESFTNRFVDHYHSDN